MKKIRFIQEFTSPSVGNVWLGRVMVLQKEQAEKFLKIGFAEEIEETNGDIKYSDVDRNKEPLADRPKRRGRNSSNLS